MAPVMDLRNVRDTTLWKMLDRGFESGEGTLARKLAEFADSVCEQAAERMKGFPALHSQYTLHDEAHLLRVTEMMAKVMPGEVLRQLNPVEVFLLILAAHLHDQGMVLDSEEVERLRTGADPQFELFKGNWEVEHPNVGEIRERLEDRNLSHEQAERYRRAEQELLDAMLTDYVRQDHGKWSAHYVRSRYGNDDRLVVMRANVAPLVAKLCESHVEPAIELSPANGFRYDEAVGQYQVNMHYLALVLRLADILDLDRDRTPDPLYRTIHFTNEVSLVEWEKHRSVEGWTIEPASIRYTMKCEHPVYQKAALEFMDWIDQELAHAHSMVRDYPAAIGKRYNMESLPIKVDRSRIEPKNGAYVYHDLEFSLSRDEIVKLFMTQELYRSASLCVRELLQNALDALRHRSALFKRDAGVRWEAQGKVTFEHFLDEERQEVLRCADNGIGMDEHIIENFLTNVGRSYYRSPEFRQERASLARADADFDPCAQFGIGFMSCFMLGDRIRIRTRRDYGPNRDHGKPLEVEVNGLGGMVVVREGAQDQEVGTTVEIYARERPLVYDEKTDQVKLTRVVYGYAVACDFPVQARCEISGIEDEVSVPAGIPDKETEMEMVGLQECETLEEEFSSIDRRLGGRVRMSFLVDQAGRPTLANREASWVRDDHFTNHKGLNLKNGDERSQRFLEFMDAYYTAGHTCLDGILVAGPLRRRSGSRERPSAAENPTNLGRAYFVLNVRGDAKPPLTPSRVPASGESGLHPGWLRLNMWASLAYGRLWERVAERLSHAEDADTFWQLADIHEALVGAALPWMHAGRMWSWLHVPLRLQDGTHEWRRLSDLGHIVAEPLPDDADRPYRLMTTDGAHLTAPESLAKWWRVEGIRMYEDREEHGVLIDWEDWPLEVVVLAMSTLTLRDDKPSFELRDPEAPDRAPWQDAFQHELLDPSGGNITYAIPYAGVLREAVSAEAAYTTVNRNHPLVQMVLEAQYRERLSNMDRFAVAAVEFFTGPWWPEAITYQNPVVQNEMRYLGNMYRAVDWNAVAPHLRLPYMAWSKELGVVSLTAEHLERWAIAPPRSEF